MSEGSDRLVPPRSHGICLIALIALGATVVWRMWVVIEKIENDPASIDYISPMFAVVCVAGAGLLTTIALTHSSEMKSLRRASRYCAWVSAIAIFIWFAPIPFGVQRIISEILLFVGAGLYGLVAIRIGWSWLSNRNLPDANWKMGGLAVLGMTCAASAVLLMAKIDAIGWSHAID